MVKNKKTKYVTANDIKIFSGSSSFYNRSDDTFSHEVSSKNLAINEHTFYVKFKGERNCRAGEAIVYKKKNGDVYANLSLIDDFFFSLTATISTSKNNRKNQIELDEIYLTPQKIKGLGTIKQQLKGDK